jgi:hypothetical protein
MVQLAKVRTYKKWGISYIYTYKVKKRTLRWAGELTAALIDEN